MALFMTYQKKYLYIFRFYHLLKNIIPSNKINKAIKKKENKHNNKKIQ